MNPTTAGTRIAAKTRRPRELVDDQGRRDEADDASSACAAGPHPNGIPAMLLRNDEVMTDSVAGRIIAPPMPATTRSVMSISTEPARRRADTRGAEDRQTGEEHRATTDAVTDSTERQEQRCERDRVGVHHPERFAR